MYMTQVCCCSDCVVGVCGKFVVWRPLFFILGVLKYVVYSCMGFDGLCVLFGL